MTSTKNQIDTAETGTANGRLPSVLLELRPALEGYAGIPQETRLLFRGLCLLPGVRVHGLFQTFRQRLARAADARDLHHKRRGRPDWKLNRYSRVVVSLDEHPYRNLLERIVERLVQIVDAAALSTAVLLRWGRIRLSDFDAQHFRDFVWRTYFAKTLPADDFELVTSAGFKVCQVPWLLMHRAGLNSLSLLSAARYAALDTRGVDVFIAQTPYPARVSAGTALVIRYHDALPVFMPHTIPDKALHQAWHFHSLEANVREGAYFACISEATRNDLLAMFPHLSDRAVTIHNMISHHYWLETAPRSMVPGVIRSRLYALATMQPSFYTLREKEAFYRRNLDGPALRYLLVVCTLEPRKNHARLLAAWEMLKAQADPELKLVVVGTLGWDFDPVMANLKPWIDRGEIFMLNAVPAADLRLLYRHADATVCPSLGEGFDYSGVEAMASGGVVVASDIPVHREVYGDASLYFDPYSTASLVAALTAVLHANDAESVQQHLRAAAQPIVWRYRPEQILPQWIAFLQRLGTPVRAPTSLPTREAERPEPHSI